MTPLATLRELAGRLVERVFPGARILLYHRVAALQRDPQWLAVAPEVFDRQLRLLAQEADVVPLEEFHRLLRARRLPRRAVAITFDDGYADNLEEAAPILARHDLPATVFVSAGGVRFRREAYWDELDRLLLGAHSLPPRFSLVLAGARRSFEVESGPGDEDPGWNATRPPETRRQRVFLELCAALQALRDGARQEALAQLRAELSLPAEVRHSHRMLDAGQLRELARCPGISVGAHAVTHPVLSRLTPQEQAEEIAGSRRELEEVIGRPVRHFAYPFGGRAHFDHVSRALVREAGFELACANIPGVVRAGSDPFALPRVLVRAWPPEAFRARLRGWLGG